MSSGQPLAQTLGRDLVKPDAQGHVDRNDFEALNALEEGHDADDFNNETAQARNLSQPDTSSGDSSKSDAPSHDALNEKTGPTTTTTSDEKQPAASQGVKGPGGPRGPGGPGGPGGPQWPIGPNIVDWDGPQDPENPMNWSTKRKVILIAVISINTFLTPLASSMIAPGIPRLLFDFHNDNTLLASFVVSIYLLGYTIGPLVVSPASEIWGRTICYNVSNVIFIGFTIGCALSSDVAMFTVFRFFQGAAGVTPLTVGGGTIADLIPMEKRGKYMAAWILGPLMGPVIGPVIGGFLSQSEGWQWTFYLLLIMSGVISIVTAVVARETFAPVLLQRKTLRLRKQTGNEALRSKMDQGLTPRDFFMRAALRPLKILFQTPIVALMAIDVGVIFSYMFLLFTTVTFVFEGQYSFNAGESGLVFLGLGIGLILAVPIIGRTSDNIMKAKKAKGQMKPEWRLLPMIPSGFLTPIGFFWYGWTVYYRVNWIVPILGLIPIGAGMVGTFMPVSLYLVDTFKMYAASAIAVTTIVRSLLGAFIPLAGQPLYRRLGLGWGNSLLGFLALLFAFAPIFLFKFGERIRTHPRFQVKL